MLGVPQSFPSMRCSKRQAEPGWASSRCAAGRGSPVWCVCRGPVAQISSWSWRPVQSPGSENQNRWQAQARSALSPVAHQAGSTSSGCKKAPRSAAAPLSTLFPHARSSSFTFCTPAISQSWICCRHKRRQRARLNPCSLAARPKLPSISHCRRRRSRPASTLRANCWPSSTCADF